MPGYHIGVMNLRIEGQARPTDIWSNAYENAPKVDQNKEHQVESSMKREDHDEKVIREGLSEAIRKVKCVGRKRSWDCE